MIRKDNSTTLKKTAKCAAIAVCLARADASKRG
jgi:hypothetical protein